MTTDYSTLDDQELEMLIAKAIGEQITPLTDANDFEKVKREIERRWNCWDVMWIRDCETDPIEFAIHIDNMPIVMVSGEREQRVGCEAFLLAVDAEKESKENNCE
jgi:hypothetical protein